MKHHIHSIIFCVSIQLLAISTHAQFTNLLDFESVTNGSIPYGSLISDGTYLYGMTSEGGANNFGTIFKVMSDGTNFTKLLDFDGALNGNRPFGSLISDGTFLYGMTYQGGVNDLGVVFKIRPDGSGYAKLLDFDNISNGGTPYGSLFSDGIFLYGTTREGGSNGYGTIFKIKPDGTSYTKILNFDYNNGAYPSGSLISDGTFLYGTTTSGNPSGYGNIFKIKPDGTGFVSLLDFDYSNNGSHPQGDLYYDGTFLYGMTSEGAPTFGGNIFKIMPDGTGYVTLLNFDAANNGAFPKGSLISDGTFLYGMTSIGGLLNGGTLFKIQSDGTGYTKLLDFNNGNPLGSLVLDGTFFYGMTNGGGANNRGSLFKASLAPFTSISSFTPTDAVVGTYITIKGTNFDPTPTNNLVQFNGTPATIISSTSTTLVAIVPTGASSGPIALSALTTATSLSDFNLTTNAIMENVTVQNCNVSFLPPIEQYNQENGYNDITQTFMPINAGDKVKISFSSFSVTDDFLFVYDGPTPASALIATLQGSTLPADIVATSPGGELTFVYNWQDGATSWDASITCQAVAGPVITITQQPVDFIACIGEIASFTTAATGASNIIFQWQYSIDGVAPFTDIIDGGGYVNATTAVLSVNTSGSFGSGRYRCKISGDATATAFTNNEGLFINSPPAAPGTTSASSCAPASLTLISSGGINGQYRWYDIPTGGIPMSGQINNSYITPILATTTTYYVSIDNGSCESLRSPVSANIDTPPSKPVIISNIAPTGASVSVCSSNLLTFSGPPGFASYSWSNGETTEEITIASSGTYSVVVTNSIGCVSPSSDALVVTVIPAPCSNQPPVINTTQATTQIAGVVSIDLSLLISDADNNIDLSSLLILVQPSSGALATISNTILTINYSGLTFSGQDKLTIQVCDLLGSCSQQEIIIDVTGDLVVFTGISPNGDAFNGKWIILNIESLLDTKENKVAIYNRWGDLIFEVENYDNNTRVFNGINKNGDEVTSGVYFYKIDFKGSRKALTGYLTVRK